MRRGLRFVGVCLASATISLSCSTTSPVADAGVEAGAQPGGPCTTSADCPSGTACGYAIGDGCSASRRCLLVSPGACKSMFACACDGTSVSVCGPSPKPIRSAGLCDAGPGCASGLACEQCDVTGYFPAPTMGSPASSLGACTQQELQDFVTACFSSTETQTTCQTWLAQDAGACAACLAPVLQSSTTWGPLDCATTTSPCGPNSGGCVDLVLQATSEETIAGGPGSCGDLITTSLGCQDYACAACSANDFQTCDQSAVTNECAGFAAMVSQANGPCATLDGDAAPPAASKCFPQSDADNVAFVNVFCGTGP